MTTSPGISPTCASAAARVGASSSEVVPVSPGGDQTEGNAVPVAGQPGRFRMETQLR